jgi:hypothetical protein
VTAVAPGASEQFAAATFDAFEAAYDVAPDRIDQRYRLAGRVLRVRYLAPELAARFHPTLAHLDHVADPDDELDLDIGCWDRSRTDVAAPPPPWGLDAYLPAARIRDHVDGPLRATYDAPARTLCLYDQERRAAVLHTADAHEAPDWMDRAPFRTILTWWAYDRGMAMVHASSVAWGDGAVLLAGASGAGKSTTAMACLAGGLDLLGDDACLVSLDACPEVWSVYRRAKLEPDAARWLSSLDDLVVVRTPEQSHVDPGARHRHHAPLRAVLLLQITGTPATRVVPVTRGEALRVLAPSTLSEGGGMARQTFTTLSALVREVPCFRLELGDDLDGVVDAVRRVIERAA